MSARYALYFVPADDSPLARFGNRILGRDALANRVPESSDDHVARSILAAPVSRYGFHATLKAPFELRSGQSKEALCQRVRQLSDALSPVTLDGLKPRRMDRHLVLSCSADSPELQELARRCVTDIEPFRAPASEADRQRRMRVGMSPRQLQYLDRHGYAHVLEDFHFHMTLGGPIPAALKSSALDDEAVDSYLDWLNDVYCKLVTDTPVLDRLALCHQPDRQSDFARLEEWVL